MKDQPEEKKTTLSPSTDSAATSADKKTMFWGITIGIIGIVLTLAMVVAIIY